MFNLLDNNRINVCQAEEALNLLKKGDKILGVVESNIDIPDEIKELIKKREEARKNKDWKKSDQIRDELLNKGVKIEDTPTGTTWKFK